MYFMTWLQDKFGGQDIKMPIGVMGVSLSAQSFFSSDDLDQARRAADGTPAELQLARESYVAGSDRFDNPAEGDHARLDNDDKPLDQTSPDVAVNLTLGTLMTNTAAQLAGNNLTLDNLGSSLSQAQLPVPQNSDQAWVDLCLLDGSDPFIRPGPEKLGNLIRDHMVQP